MEKNTISTIEVSSCDCGSLWCCSRYFLIIFFTLVIGILFVIYFVHISSSATITTTIPTISTTTPVITETTTISSSTTTDPDGIWNFIEKHK